MGAKFSKDQSAAIETRPEVLTPYGVGLELNSKTRADGMTAVQLPWAVAYVPASSLTRPFSLVRTPGGVGVVRSVNNSVADVKLSWADAQVNTDAKDVTKVYDHSDLKLRVKTAYGEGILRGAARLDGLLTVQLPWAIAYCSPDAVTQIL